MDSLMRKTSRLGLAICLVVAGLMATARGEGPQVHRQAPGYYRMLLGQFEVTALLDGHLEIDTALLRNISESEIQSLLTRAFLNDPHKVPIASNAYLVNTGSQVILVDAGSGQAVTPQVGQLIENLRASGYTPEQVDVVLLTHLHADHFGGLLDAEGQPAFPKATVYLSQVEYDTWTSAAMAEEVPPEFRDYVVQIQKLVQRAADAYQGHWKTFAGSELPVSGVTARPDPGHTPGHTAYEITSEGQSLLILGDTIHCAAVQFPRPDAAVMFDSDTAQAVTSRMDLFRRVAGGKTLLAGMHLAFPGLGRLRSEGPNSFAWVPLDFAPLPDIK